MTRAQLCLGAGFAVLGVVFLGGVLADIPLFWGGAAVGMISICAYLSVRLARLVERRLGELRTTSGPLSSSLEATKELSAQSFNAVKRLEQSMAALSKRVEHHRTLTQSNARMTQALLVEQAALLRQQQRLTREGAGDVASLAIELKGISEAIESLGKDLALLGMEAKHRGSAIDGIAHIGRDIQERCDAIKGGLSRVAEGLAAVEEHLPVEQRMKRNFEHALAASSMETVRSVEALLQLERAYGFSFGPLFGGWAMDPISMHGVLKVVSGKKQPRIVELGSGVSTIWLAKSLMGLGGGQLVSLEHQKAFADDIKAYLVSENLENWATVVHAPLRGTLVGGREFNWYDISDVAFPEHIDILLVDGPPGDAGDKSRYPAFPILRKHLKPGSVIILDDTNRRDESEILTMWSEIEGIYLSKPAPIGPRTTLLTVVEHQAER